MAGSFVRVDKTSQDVPRWVRVDQTLFTAAILNLAINARNAMPNASHDGAGELQRDERFVGSPMAREQAAANLRDGAMDKAGTALLDLDSSIGRDAEAPVMFSASRWRRHCPIRQGAHQASKMRFQVQARSNQSRWVEIAIIIRRIGLAAHRDKQQTLVAGIPDDADVDLSLIRLPVGALLFPGENGTDLTKLRCGRAVSRNFKRRIIKLGFPATLRLHDLRGSHETVLLDAGVNPKVVADTCGHDVATMLKVYAKRVKKADAAAADAIGTVPVSALAQK